MKKVLSLTALACAIALCFALVGCGGSGGSSDKQIDKTAFVGTYTLTEIVEDGEATSQEDLEMLKSFGMESTLELDADNTATMNLFGEEAGGKWEATAANAGRIELADFGSGTFTLEADKLVMVSGSDKMTFTKNS